MGLENFEDVVLKFVAHQPGVPFSCAINCL